MDDALRANNQTTTLTRLSPTHVRPLLAGLLFGVLLVSGCRPALQAAERPLHWPTAAPPPLRGANPVLSVALADHLPAEAGLGQLLDLRAATGRLSLKDGKGLQRQGERLQIRWQQQALPAPFLIERQVLGPFPSYESAAEQARRWRLRGGSPLVAHPGDWEVWAPFSSPAPQGAVRHVRQEHLQRWNPALQEGESAMPLQGPVSIAAPGGLLWRGARYDGNFRLQADAYGTWTLVVQLPIERYLEGVVPHEIGAGSPLAAQRAQAILARTWALTNRGRFAVDGYNLCADTQCQVFSDPSLAGPEVRQAVRSTAGKVLTWNGRPLNGVYSASNGGVAAGFDEVWQGEPVPYLQPAIDAMPAQARRHSLPISGEPALVKLLEDAAVFNGQAHPRHRWQRRFSAAELGALTAADGIGTVQEVRVARRGPSGRVLDLQLRGSAGELLLERDQIRRRLRSLPSTLFVVVREQLGQWRFDGGGFGHGAGLSQAGAIELAQRGWSGERILSHYFPGSKLRPIGSLPIDGSP
jgi:SpoIID/LytB domain protein